MKGLAVKKMKEFVFKVPIIEGTVGNKRPEPIFIMQLKLHDEAAMSRR